MRAYKSKHLTKDVYNRIRPVGSTRPRMYGVPKIHKADIPLRPILSMINSPQHELAKLLTEILQPVVNKYSTFTVKDTFEFCEKLEEFSDSCASISETFMCSFDIKSLFTNVPLKETIDICVNVLSRDEEVPTPGVPEDLLRKLLLKATTEVEFSFNNIIFKQTDGVAMDPHWGQR